MRSSWYRIPRTLILRAQPAHLEHSHARWPSQLEAIWQLAPSLTERIEQAATCGQRHGAPRVAQRPSDLALPFQLDEGRVPAQPGVLLQQAQVRPLRGDEGVVPRVAEEGVREGRLDGQAGCVADAAGGSSQQGAWSSCLEWRTHDIDADGPTSQILRKMLSYANS